MKNILKKYFGYDSFRDGQLEIAEYVSSKKDLVVVMPTGGGKSLCYQIPALFLEGMCVVVSPLISLMKDQVDTLQKKSIEAFFLNSTQSKDESEEILRKCLSGKVKLLYISPEKLESEDFRVFLSKINISFFAIDETHCVAQWGNDFRPAYKSLGKNIDIISNLKGIRISRVALTATATESDVDVVKNFLSLEDPRVVVKGFFRSNLALNVINTENKKDILLRMISRDEKGVIVYSSTTSSAEKYSNLFNENGFNSSFYHGKLPPEERSEIQDKFLKDEINIIFSTNAFGMGVDKPNVKKVFHTDIPINIENYYQEAGRAGRDGSESDCVLLFSNGDRRTIEFLIDSSLPPKEAVRGLAEIVANWPLETFDLEPYEIMLICRHIKSNMIESCYQALKDCGMIDIVSVVGDKGYEKIYEIKDRTAVPDYEKISFLRQIKRKKLDAVERFAKTNSCRMSFILKYFGSSDSHECGKCDNCKRKKEEIENLEDVTDIAKKIIRIANGNSRLTKELLIDYAIGENNRNIIYSKEFCGELFGFLFGYERDSVFELVTEMENGCILINNGHSGDPLYPSRAGVKMLDDEVGDNKFYIKKGLLVKNKNIEKENKTISLEIDRNLVFIERLEKVKKEISNEFKIPVLMVINNTQSKKLLETKPSSEAELIEYGILDKNKAKAFGKKIISIFNQQG